MTTQNDDTVRNGSDSEHSVQPLVRPDPSCKLCHGTGRYLDTTNHSIDECGCLEMARFERRLIEAQKPMPPEFAQVIEENFNDLLV